jgi:hypothetical protein
MVNCLGHIKSTQRNDEYKELGERIIIENKD